MGTIKTISWKVSKDDATLLGRIVERARSMTRRKDKELFPLGADFVMDLHACHANSCPLDLERLLAADDFNFAHDVFGIHRHMDRETGTLQDCFMPRFAKATT